MRRTMKTLKNEKGMATVEVIPLIFIFVYMLCFEFGDFAQVYQDSNPDAAYVGARVPFKSNVLNLRLPFLGSTADDSTTGTATLNAYLMREVTTDECRTNFTMQRLQQIKALDSTFNSLPTQPEALITDNGC